jgi:hypothetical protein
VTRASSADARACREERLGAQLVTDQRLSQQLLDPCIGHMRDQDVLLVGQADLASPVRAGQRDDAPKLLDPSRPIGTHRPIAERFTAEHQLTTPAQWQPGGDAIIAGSVNDEQARERYPDGWEQPLPYMHIVAAP